MVVYDGISVGLTLVASIGAGCLAIGTYNGTAFVGDFSVGAYGDISVDVDEVAGHGDLLTGYTYKYGISFLYDGYQEGQLNELSSVTITTENASAVVKIAFEETFDPGKRVTHVNLYRSARYGDGEDFIAAPYRLVESIEATSDNFVATEIGDGDYFRGIFQDTGRSGASYEALALVSETLSDVFTPEHELSVLLHGYRIIANVEHSELDGENGLILRSVLNRPSVFNWAEDTLPIKGQLIAMVAFNNRIYAFDTANMYRINIDSLYVEDVTSGLGISSPKQVCVTEFGMMVAAKHNVYLHDGAKLQPIGDAITSNDLTSAVGGTFTFSSVGYKDNTATPIAGYDSYTNSFYLSFEDSSGTSKKMYYVYNLGTGKWVMRTALNSSVSSTVANTPVCMGNMDDGRLLVATATEIYQIGGSARVALWLYVTKNMMLNRGAEWRLYDVVKTGTSTASILVYYWGGSWITPIPDKHPSAATQLAFLAASNAPVLDSASLLIRRLGAHDATV